MASLVWKRFGAVTNYVEPFFGSGAVLLSRPQPFDGVETCNDLDCYIANFWRSTKYDPGAVVEWCDWPVNEVDLHSNHRWLVLGEHAEEFRRRMRTDPDYFDAKVAGRWVHGACCWIGSGWCDESQLKRYAGQRIPLTKRHGEGLNKKRPRSHSESTAGGGSLPGVHANPEHLRQGRPQLADAYDVGRGVHASPPEKRPGIGGPHPGSDGLRGVHGGPDGTCAERRAWLLDWFGRLADRLRDVRVCCGDWSRACSSPSVLTRLGPTAVFLDPPYPRLRKDGSKSRAGNLYGSDGDGVKTPEALRDEILAWCRKWGHDRLMRVAVCGYDGDYALEEEGWTVEAWKAAGGYGNRTEDGKHNATRERIWYSPHCCFERTLFDPPAPTEGGPA